MGHGNKIRVIGALTAANIFPALAMIWLLDRIRAAKRDKNFKHIIASCFIGIIITSAISLMGAMYLSGILADVRYFLEKESYPEPEKRRFDIWFFKPNNYSRLFN